VNTTANIMQNKTLKYTFLNLQRNKFPEHHEEIVEQSILARVDYLMDVMLDVNRQMRSDGQPFNIEYHSYLSSVEEKATRLKEALEERAQVAITEEKETPDTEVDLERADEDLDEESSWDPDDDTDTSMAHTKKDDTDWMPSSKRVKRESPENEPPSLESLMVHTKQDQAEDDYPGGEAPEQLVSAVTSTANPFHHTQFIAPPRIDPSAFAPWGAFQAPPQYHQQHAVPQHQFSFPLLLASPANSVMTPQSVLYPPHPQATLPAMPPALPGGAPTAPSTDGQPPTRRNSLFTALVDASVSVLESGKPEEPHVV